MRRVLIAVGAVCSAAVVSAPGVARARAVPLRVASAVSAGPVSEVLRPTGLLSTRFGPLGSPALFDVKIADGTLVGLYGSEVVVFGRPAAGWAHATAPATFLAGVQGPADDVVGNGFVAVAGRESVGVTVLTRPADGWSGPLSASAQLSAAPGSVLVAAGGDTVVTADLAAGEFAPGYLQLFVRPGAGWSGTIAPAAQLQTSDGQPLFQAVVSGNTIVAVGVQAVYVFVKPAGGWSGVITDTARIPLADSSVALSGRTLVAVTDSEFSEPPTAPVYVLHRPTAGWQAATLPQPVASIAPPGDPFDGAGVGVAIAGDNVPVIAASTLGGEHVCPCFTKLWAVGNASSTVSPQLYLPSSASLENTEDSSVAVDGDTVAFGSDDGVLLYTITPALKVAHAALAGLTTGTPTLSLTVTAQPNAARISSIRIGLPGGLRARTPRSLLLTSNPPHRSKALVIRAVESSALRQRLSRIRADGGRQVLTLPIQVVDTSDHSSRSTVTFTITR